MSECSSGDISVSCPGGCGLVCWSHYCRGWCEPEVIDMGEVRAKEPIAVKPTVVEVRRDGGGREGGAKEAAKPEGSDSVKLCAHGLSREGLLAGLGAVLETELEPSRADGGQGKELPFSGTVDELLDYLDLRRSDGSTSS